MGTARDGGNYVGTLDSGLPADGDDLDDGAAEIRQVKVQLENTFTGFTGAAVTLTEAEINAHETRLDAIEADYVAGPGSSTDDNIVTWNGTGGQDIQDSGVALADLQTALATGTTADITGDDTTPKKFAGDQINAAITAAIAGTPFWDFEDEILPPLTTNIFFSANHGFGSVPSLIEVVARCKTATAGGFAVGDEFLLRSEHYYTRVSEIKNTTLVGVYISADWYIRSSTGTQLRMDLSGASANFSIVLRAKK